MSAAYSVPFGAAKTLPGTYPPVFERLIYYMLAPDLFARIVLEAGLNISPLAMTQPKLWVFYILILIEYVIQSLTLGQQRFRINISNVAFLLLSTMAIHGLIAGLFWGNKIPKTLTDTVPVVVTALNVAMLNREGAFRGFDFNRLVKVVLVFCFAMVTVGLVAQAAHRSTIVSLGGAGSTPICLTVILVYLNGKKKLSVVDLLFVSFIIGPTVPTTNRTTLAVFSLAFAIFVLPHLFRNAKQLYFSVFFFGIIVAAFVAFVPADSPLVSRVNGLIEHVTADKSEESGSLYERQAEWEAIKQKLAHLGPTGEYFGYGAGGIYYPQFTIGVPENYSHAHYAWSLFRLRYGYVGFFYLALFSALLLHSLISHILKPDPLSRTVSVLAMWSIVFLFTYVFFNFLAAGLQFAYTSDDEAENR